MASERLRTQHPDEVYFISNACILNLVLMLPLKRINDIIAGALTRAASQHEVTLFGFVFLVNRFYLLVRAPHLNLPEFMKALQKEIACEINRTLERKGRVFRGTYIKSDVRGKKALLERLIAIICAPVEAGLVREPEDWPGVASWVLQKAKKMCKGIWFNRTEFAKLKRRSENIKKPIKMPKNAGEESYEVPIAKLPGFEEMSDDDYIAMLKEEMKFHKSVARHRHKGKFEDLKKLLKRPWFSRLSRPQVHEIGKDRVKLDEALRRLHPKDRDPEALSSFSQPVCYANEEDGEKYMREYLAIRHLYAVAMKRYVEKDDARYFPETTCRPGVFVCKKAEGWWWRTAWAKQALSDGDGAGEGDDEGDAGNEPGEAKTG